MLGYALFRFIILMLWMPDVLSSTCATEIVAGTPVSLGSCTIGAGISNSNCDSGNGENYQPMEHLNGTYPITDTDGVKYSCDVRATGGYGVPRAACCNCEASDALSATRSVMFRTSSSYTCYYSCHVCAHASPLLPPPSSSPSPPPSRPVNDQWQRIQFYPSSIKLANMECKTIEVWLAEPLISPDVHNPLLVLRFESDHTTFNPVFVEWSSEIADDWKTGRTVNVCANTSLVHGTRDDNAVTTHTASELYHGWNPNLVISLIGSPVPPPSSSPLAPPPSASPLPPSPVPVSPPSPNKPPSSTWLRATSLADVPTTGTIEAYAYVSQTIDFSDSSSLLKESDYVYFNLITGPGAEFTCETTLQGDKGSYVTADRTVHVTLQPGFHYCCLNQNGIAYPHFHISIHAKAIAPSSPPAPEQEVCVNGTEWRLNVHPDDQTCLNPNLVPSTQLVDRCACPTGRYMQFGSCVDPNECTLVSPRPPPPSAPPPQPPTPPLMPNSYSPQASTPCDFQQEDENKQYCYDRQWSTLVCALDGGIRCPERCGICKRVIRDNPITNSFIKIKFVFNTEIQKFDRPVFRRRIAESLQISEAQVKETLAAGSTIVEVHTFTVEGTASAAVELGNTFNQVFKDISDTVELLGHVATEMSATLSIPEPSPPTPPETPPPVPPHTPQPLLPPHTPPQPPEPSAPPTGPSSSDTNTAAVAGVVVGSLIFIIFVTVVAHVSTKSNEKGAAAPTGVPAESKPLVLTTTAHADSLSFRF